MKRKWRNEFNSVAVLVALSAVSLCAAPLCTGKEKSDRRSGEELYKQYCSSCHVAGGNTAKPSKPIAGSKVIKSIATFQKYLEDPPGHMPYYKTIVSDKAVVKKLYDYCKTLKKTQGA